MEDALVAQGADAAQNQEATSPTPEAASDEEKPLSTGSAVRLALGLPALYLLLLFIEGTRYIWTTITVFLYALVILFTLLWFLANPSERVEKRRVQAGVATWSPPAVILAAIALLVSFSQISKFFYIAYGGFDANSTGYWHWLRFGFANLFEGALFDIPSVYNWGVSEIQPTSFWTQTLVFTFRTALEFLVVANIIKQYRHARRTRGLRQTVDHGSYMGYLFTHLKGLLLLTIWSIPTAIGVSAILSDGLYVEASWSAIKLAAPVVLGAWLAWQSIKALSRFSGPRDKLLALAGVLIGLWLALANWPVLRDYLGT